MLAVVLDFCGCRASCCMHPNPSLTSRIATFDQAASRVLKNRRAPRSAHRDWARIGGVLRSSARFTARNIYSLDAPEPRRRQLGVAHRVLDRAVAEPILQRPRG